MASPTYTLKLGADRTLALPAEVLADLSLHEGDELVLLKSSDGYRLMSQQKLAEMRLAEEQRYREQQRVVELFGTIDPEDMDSEEEMRAQRKRM